MQVEARVTDLFSIPIILADASYSVSEAELDFIRSGEYELNSGGNFISKDKSILSNPELSEIRSFIEVATDVYVKELLKWVPENNIYTTQSWVNRNSQGASHSPHTHPNSYISGVFYLTDNPEPTVFSQRHNPLFPLDMPTTEANLYNERFRKHLIKPEKKGQLLLFPSTTEHFVPPNAATEERMTLSFNTWVRGSAGSVQNVNHLEII